MLELPFRNLITYIDLVLKGGLLLAACFCLLGGGGTDEGEVGDDLLGVLRLASAGLAGNQDRLVLTLYTEKHHLLYVYDTNSFI